MNEILMALGGVAGLALLYFGADWLVRGGSSIAVRARVSPLVIGLTLVAFGTSAPELFVSTGAALHGLGDICIGNVVGSNICNIALILGLTGLVAPIAVNAASFRRDMLIMVAASAVVTAWCGLTGGLGRIAGFVFVVAIVTYTCHGVVMSRKTAAERPEKPSIEMGRAIALAFVGLAVLVVGAKLILAGAVAIEKGLGVPDEFVALTVVAVGTSLPELATSVVAARKGEADIAIGNIVGSNIFNILGILGTSALIRPVAVAGMDWVDFGMMIATAALLRPLLGARGRLGRTEGAILLAVYGGYLVWLVRTL